ncbi:MAG: hypothetical protein HYS18_06835 [Burkholderiales bacterium]|nr:hypothetical protein [Burkholderiales bacterium]
MPASFFVEGLAVGLGAVAGAAFTGLAGALAGLATVLVDFAVLAVRVLAEVPAFVEAFFAVVVAGPFFAGVFLTVAFIVLSLKNCPTLFISRSVM